MMRQYLLVFFFGLFAFCWLLSSGCNQASKGLANQSSEASQGAEKSAAAGIAVVKPKRMTLQWTTQGPGYIQAYEQTPMFAKIAGYVQKWHVDIGDHVSEGQLLAELWIPEMELEVKQKEALVAQA